MLIDIKLATAWVEVELPHATCFTIKLATAWVEVELPHATCFTAVHF